ncbi:hypothetical protein D3C80_624700 [compost metagenome]
MGYHHHGHAFIGQFDHNVQHFVDHFRIERRSGLIEQHGDRIHAQRSGDSHALLLAAGKLARELVGVCGQADALQQFQAFLARGVFVAFEHFHLRQRQVIDDRQVREKLEVLEYHTDLGTQLRQIGFLVVDRSTVHQDIALLDRLQTVDGFDQGRLARA